MDLQCPLQILDASLQVTLPAFDRTHQDQRITGLPVQLDGLLTGCAGGLGVAFGEQPLSLSIQGARLDGPLRDAGAAPDHHGRKGSRTDQDGDQRRDKLPDAGSIKHGNLARGTE